MKLRPWNNIKINECNEPLISIPESIFRLTPHPYMSLGAPYLMEQIHGFYVEVF